MKVTLQPFQAKKVSFSDGISTALKSLSALLFFGVLIVELNAQTIDGKISIATRYGAQPISGVEVNLYQLMNERDTFGTRCYVCFYTTDSEGIYSKANIPLGDYRIELKHKKLYPQRKSYYARIEENKRTEIIAEMDTIKPTDEIIVSAKPVIKNIGDGPVFIPGTPTPDRLMAGLVSIPGAGLSIKASRPGTTGIYLEGSRMNGGVLPGKLSMSSMSARVGGLPARFGDLIGGVVEYSYKAPGMFREFLVQANSAAGLDPYGNHSAECFYNLPLLKRKEKVDGRTMENLLVGLDGGLNLDYAKDNSPVVNGVYYLKPELQKQMEENPLVILPNNFVHRGNFITQGDLIQAKAHRNAPQFQTQVWGKLLFNLNRNTSLTAFGSYDYTWGYAASNQIMNYNQAARYDNKNIFAFLLYNQNLQVSKSGSLKNAFYQVKTEYQSGNYMFRDAQHLNNYFNYGYLGKYELYGSEIYNLVGNESTDPAKKKRLVINQFGDSVYIQTYYEQAAYSDTLLNFNGAEINKNRAQYTQQIFDYFRTRNSKVSNMDQLTGVSGLRNGDNLSYIYNLWAAPGFLNTQFNKSSSEKYAITATAQFEYKAKKYMGIERMPHNLQVGMYAEQLINRGYSLAANNLWGLMRQLVNKQIDMNIGDKNSEISHVIMSMDANGNFTDTIRYQKLLHAEEQTYFDKQLRTTLMQKNAKDVYGKTIDEWSLLNVDRYNPAEFTLDMFSADELLNNGNPLVNYYGFDYLGKKLKGKPPIEGFLNNPKDRSLGAFTPVYGAAWLEDFFQYKDLIFRLGLRLERYDANQYVLKDPYLLYPAKTAGELNGTMFNGKVFHKPSNIGENFVVYADDIENPEKIVGYRNGDKWYNEAGVELNSPEFLANATKTGRISPLLENPGRQVLGRESLVDFKPIINLLPRLFFSFPLKRQISEFFISYDVLAQRPSFANSFLSMDDLYYLKQKQGSIINNAGLQSRIKHDYEVGYRQIFGKKKNGNIDLTVYYSEIRKDFGQFQIAQGYPVTYITYRNVDFSNVTGVRTSFSLDRIGPFGFHVNYTYQIADGTGSNVNSQAALVASGQPNLRNIIPLGELDIRHAIKGVITAAWGGTGKFPGSNARFYRGPSWAGIDWFRNTSISCIFNAYSGAPYTVTKTPAQIGSLDRQQTAGEPYSARMAWRNTVDINITKGFEAGERIMGRRNQRVSLFMNITNLFNLKNVMRVYSYTGSPVDDGYLNSPKGQQAISNQISAQSFVDLYKAYLNSNAGYLSPRRVELGLRFSL